MYDSGWRRRIVEVGGNCLPRYILGKVDTLGGNEDGWAAGLSAGTVSGRLATVGK